MVFSSTVFLFIFFPLVVAINFLLPRSLRNSFLLIASLFFYAWGEGVLVILMVVSTGINYLAGLGISYFRPLPVSKRRPWNNRLAWNKIILGAAITLNLSFLVYYKYLNFIVQMFPFLASHFSAATSAIVLPIGISFYTFHAISYLIDIYRKGLEGESNAIDLGLYIAFFPQLVAGPIVRYSDIANQLHSRKESVDLFFEGSLRFIRGLGKKVIFANTVGLMADRIFALPAKEIPTSISWLGVVCYTLQIYYDFSGYSDMAIGLAKMFGFNFKENFNYPYIAKSIQDFWRRWHISLSTWFRDYLYISLGGNQLGAKRTYINLIIVFFITGLWHGASWNFVVWGLFHGLFLILERNKTINLDKFPDALKHVYTLLVVMVGWVFFRSDTLSFALEYIGRMVGISPGANYSSLVLINHYTLLILVLAIIFTAPVRSLITRGIASTTAGSIALIGRCAFYLILLVWAIDELAIASYNPFIYFRF
jgi:alginate O-acetyltransferase complex protein AlgI